MARKKNQSAAPRRAAPDKRPCPIEQAIETIGGKWKVIVLWWLLEGPRRFNELGRCVPDISQKVLSQQLRELERDGFVSRTVYPDVPPRVEYKPTPLATSLRPALDALWDWAEENMAVVLRARERGAAPK